MRRFLSIILLMCSLVLGQAAQVSLSWSGVSKTEDDTVLEYRAYAKTNSQYFLYATTPYPSRGMKFNVIDGVQYSFYVTALGVNKIESIPSNVVKFKKLEIPPPNILTCVIDTYTPSTLNPKYWTDVKVSWPALDKNRYEFTNYYVHFVSGANQTYVVQTNYITFKQLPEDVYFVYVVVTNAAGVSSITNKGASLRISEKNPYEFVLRKTK